MPSFRIVVVNLVKTEHIHIIWYILAELDPAIFIFLVLTLFPHLPDNTENKSQNKSEDTYHSRVHTEGQKCPAASFHSVSSQADTIATMLATNKARIPDMSALVESIEHLSKDASRLIKSYKNPEHLTNDNFETSTTKKSCSVPTCYNSFPRLSPKNQIRNGFASCQTAWPHTLFLDENISQKLQQANPLIQPSFSLSFSHSRQYNGACLTLRKGVELRVPLDLSNLLQTKARNRLSWHCKFK